MRSCLREGRITQRGLIMRLLILHSQSPLTFTAACRSLDQTASVQNIPIMKGVDSKATGASVVAKQRLWGRTCNKWKDFLEFLCLCNYYLVQQRKTEGVLGQKEEEGPLFVLYVTAQTVQTTHSDKAWTPSSKLPTKWRPLVPLCEGLQHGPHQRQSHRLNT